MLKWNLTKLSLLLGLGLLLTGSSSVTAQDTETKQAAAPEKTPEQKEKDLAMTIELYSTIMAKTFEKADVEEAQMDKIKEIIDTCIPNLVQTRSRLESILTSEQKKKYAAALRQALKAKYSQKDAEAYGLRKLKLSDDVLQAYQKAKVEVEKINQDMNDQIEALLTDEQKARLPMFAKKGPKLIPNKIKFPGMKSDADAKKIEDLVKTIKGAKISEVNVPTQAMRIDVPAGTNLNVEMEKLIKADNKILEGWEKMALGSVFRSGTGGPAGSGAKRRAGTPGSTPGAATSGAKAGSNSKTSADGKKAGK